MKKLMDLSSLFIRRTFALLTYRHKLEQPELSRARIRSERRLTLEQPVVVPSATARRNEKPKHWRGNV